MLSIKSAKVIDGKITKDVDLKYCVYGKFFGDQDQDSIATTPWQLEDEKKCQVTREIVCNKYKKYNITDVQKRIIDVTCSLYNESQTQVVKLIPKKTDLSKKNIEIENEDTQLEVKQVKIIKDSKLYRLTRRMCTKEELKQKFRMGCQDPKKYTAKVKKNEIFKLVFMKNNYATDRDYAFITNTKDWRRKGSIEGYIPIENIKFLEEMYVFKVKNPKTKSTKTKSTKVAETNLSIQVLDDSSSPNIIVSEEFESNSQLMAEISGSINDESEIASLTIDGYEVSINNSNFKKEFFVKPKGQDVEIVAIDIHGNKSSKIVSLKRQKVVIQQVKLDSLNPTKIQSDISANKAALIIGVENYKNTFSALYAENDALYFNDFAFASLGVPKENIKLLINNDAGRNDTLGVVKKWLPKVIRDNETHLYVYFSGHGLASEDGSDLFLLPTDGDPELLELTSLMRNQLFDQIAELNPKHVTVFLDTCYSGASRTEELLVAARPIFIDAQEQDIPSNFTIFSASSNTETAKVLKEAEHGLFSYYMMKGLEGDADTNSDNQITNGELFAFINKNVSRQANQTPQLNGIADQVLTQW